MKRSVGVLMHISSLFGDYSIGSFGEEAKAFVDFLKRGGFSYWQVLPFCLTDECNSPYKSFSAFSGNPWFIDLPALMKDGLLTSEELEQAKQKTPYACEFDRLRQERLDLLRKAARRFGEKEAVYAFAQKYPHVSAFCRFMARKEANGNLPWNEWTTEDYSEEEYYFWAFTQFVFFRQWAQIKEYANRQGIKIIGDIPIYVAFDSCDLEADRNQFLLGKDGKPSFVAGVPPDYFCPEGQLWGNPLYNWEAMKKDGYAWWQERMKHMFNLFDGVRLDHFRGLESYYRIPVESQTAKEGEWVKGPGKDFIDVLRRLAKDRLVIAEDLGDIDDAVRELVEYSRFPGMRVLQFAFDSGADSPHRPHNYSDHSVAYTGTHDNNTLLGYIWEITPEKRRELFSYCGYEGEDFDTGFSAILRTMYASHAPLLILPIQDLLRYGLDTRMNQPGRAEGNWSYRLTKDQMNGIDTGYFRHLAEQYGRK